MLERTRIAAGRVGIVAITVTLALAGGGVGAPEDVGTPSDGSTAHTSQITQTTVPPVPSDELDGVRVRLGTGDFTEAVVLGQIVAQAWRAAGASVTLTEHIPGVTGVRGALDAGDVDATVDYTGTVWINYMRHGPLRGADQQYTAVSAADRERNAVAWSGPAAFNNTYGFAMRSDDAQKLGIRTIAGLLERAAEQTDELDDLTLCVPAAFVESDSGLAAVERVYGHEWPTLQLRVTAPEVIERALSAGTACTVGVVFTTAGWLRSDDLVTLTDTEQALPSFVPAVQIDQRVVSAHPSLLAVATRTVQELDVATMRELNAAVDDAGRLPAEVAGAHLRSRGLLRRPPQVLE